MQVKFTKMHGLGNDFVLIDAQKTVDKLSAEQCQTLADRHRGVGCDQILWLTGSEQTGYSYAIFNSDGSEAEQCGNGVRCVAQYLREQGLWCSERIQLRCLAGIIDVFFVKEHFFCVNMGEAQSLELIGDLSLVSMGNPHVISFVNELSHLNLEVEVKKIKEKLKINNGINASFVKIKNRSKLDARVFERGVGETLACGSAACAIVVAGQARKLLDKKVDVVLPGGVLTIETKNDLIFMTGPAVRVFDGIIDIKQ